MRDLYVGDLVSSFNNENLVYKFYQDACNILIERGFQLRNWITNFKSLQKHINENSCEVNPESYIKKKILVVECNVSKDEFIFTFFDIIEVAESVPVTKEIF